MIEMVEGELVFTVLPWCTHPEGRVREGEREGRERGRGLAYSEWNDAKYLVSAVT